MEPFAQALRGPVISRESAEYDEARKLALKLIEATSRFERPQESQ